MCERPPARTARRSSHPDFDYENRIVTVRSAAGHGRVDLRARTAARIFPPRCAFLEALDSYAAEFQTAGRPLVLCGDLNVARTDMDVHPKERKPRAIGQLPEERALIERIISRGLVDVHRQVEPDNADLFTWWAPWRNMKQRNIGWRLDYVLASTSIAARAPSRASCSARSAPAITDRSSRFSTCGSASARDHDSANSSPTARWFRQEIGAAERLSEQSTRRARGRRCGTGAPLRLARAPAPLPGRARSLSTPRPWYAVHDANALPARYRFNGACQRAHSGTDQVPKASASPSSSGGGFMSSGTAATTSANRSRLSVRLEGTAAVDGIRGQMTHRNRSIEPLSRPIAAQHPRVALERARPRFPATSHRGTARHHVTLPRRIALEVHQHARMQQRRPGVRMQSSGPRTSPAETRADLRRSRAARRRGTAWPRPSDSNASAR